MQNIVISREEAVRLREGYRNTGKTVGFTSGVFDIVHAGHVEYLEEAKRRVDILIVGVDCVDLAYKHLHFAVRIVASLLRQCAQEDEADEARKGTLKVC